MIMDVYRSNETSKRLHYIPGIGPLLATALVASVADPKGFPIRAQLLGLDWARAEAALERRQGQARQYQQTGRPLSAQAVGGRRTACPLPSPWLTALLARRPTKVAAIALANKLARMAWAMIAKGERYRQPVALAA